MCGPSLYKHLPDKAALEAEIISDGFAEAAAALEAAVDGAGEPLTAFVDAYRAFAVAHPHVYRLMTERPLPRERLPPGLETRTAAPLVRAVGSPERARAAWAFIHGMIMLELNGRFPSDGVTEAAWRSGTTAFDGGTPRNPPRRLPPPDDTRSPGNSPRPQPSSVAQFVEQFGFHPALARRPRSVRNRLAATDAAARLRPGPRARCVQAHPALRGVGRSGVRAACRASDRRADLDQLRGVG